MAKTKSLSPKKRPVKKTTTKKTVTSKPVKKTPSSSSRQGILGELKGTEPDEEGVKFGLYGVTGTGKTRFLSTWPKPMLIIDCNCGVRSIKGVEGIERFVVDRASKVDAINELVEQQANEKRWKTIAVDHATELHRLVLASVLDLEQLPEQLSWKTATREQHTKAGAGTINFLNKVLHLAELTGCNAIVVAQQRDFEVDEESEIAMPSVSFGLPPAVTGWLGPAVDYVTQSFIRQKTEKVDMSGVEIEQRTSEMQYCLRVGAHHVYAAKFRLSPGQKIDDVIVQPTYGKLKKYF